ncbi:MAG TPA: glycosyltransferase [Thermoplasmata archaeon]|nr:glycosyltransferase [Thermoplasmata archaeon]
MIAHDPARRPLLEAAVASAAAAGADEIVVVRPYDAPLGPWEGRYRDVRTSASSTGGKHADGVEAARGDVVALLDDDDTWKPEKVGVVRDRFAARRDLVLLNHGYDIVDEHDRFLRAGTPSGGRWALSSNLALRRAWATARTSLLRAAGWQADEVWLLLADVDAPNGIEVLDRSLTRWRYHAGNISRSHRTSEREFRARHSALYDRWAQAEEAMLAYARQRGVPDGSPIAALHLRRRSEFRFLSALEHDRAPRAAARTFLAEGEGQPPLRRLARLARLSPGLARYLLFRFNRFH